jgi:hypothetical protein
MSHDHVQIISSQFRNCSVESDIGAPCDVRERRDMSVLELGCVINCIALRRQGAGYDRATGVQRTRPQSCA